LLYYAHDFDKIFCFVLTTKTNTYQAQLSYYCAVFTKSLCIYLCKHEGGKKKSIPFRRQRMEIDDMVPPSDHMPVPVLSEDPYVADLLKVADENIARLREETRVAHEETAGLEGKVSNLQHQVRT